MRWSEPRKRSGSLILLINSCYSLTPRAYSLCHGLLVPSVLVRPVAHAFGCLQRRLPSAGDSGAFDCRCALERCRVRPSLLLLGQHSLGGFCASVCSLSHRRSRPLHCPALAGMVAVVSVRRECFHFATPAGTICSTPLGMSSHPQRSNHAMERMADRRTLHFEMTSTLRLREMRPLVRCRSSSSR
jgi:hypothetical protein